jgi:Leucine-rich repeat (LRR) protein
LQLEELDLSYNQLTALLPRDLGLVPSLQKLILRANRISVMSDLSLSGTGLLPITT